MRFVFLGIMFALFGAKMLLEGNLEWWTIVSISVAALASTVCFWRAIHDSRLARAGRANATSQE